MYYVENEDVVGAAPTGDAPTTSEWSINVIAHKGAPYIRDLTVHYFFCIHLNILILYTKYKLL